jgi:hypothetical protein
MKKVFAFALLLPLMGQGCLGYRTEPTTESSRPATAEVDAAVNAELDDAAGIEREEREGDTDTDLVENDTAEINAYAETKYELP